MMRMFLLAGVAALFLATGAAHATVQLPEAMLGKWCWAEGGDESNPDQQIYTRTFPGECHGGDSLIRIDQDGIEGEGSCIFEKIIEQTGPYTFLIYTDCDGMKGPTKFEIVDEKLVITALSEG
jgi:hypothetical protein